MNDGQQRSVGFWSGLIRQFRLTWRLLWDPRVPSSTKLVPFLTLLYIISPIDFLPDWFLGLGQLDDLGVLLLGVRLFTQLSPEQIVMQHLEAMGFPVNQWRVVQEEEPSIEGGFVDAEYEVHDE
jgi:uncharacterized membrane protein YkvA (DUF1232 family)